MAVEDLKGVYVMAMAGLVPARAASFHHFDNPVKQLADRVAVPSGASIASTIELGQLKTSAVLSALGFVQFAALAASTTLKVGLKDEQYCPDWQDGTAQCRDQYGLGRQHGDRGGSCAGRSLQAALGVGRFYG